jgi:hypothetical protein
LANGAPHQTGPVFQLFGLKGVGGATTPPDNAPRQAGAIGDHVRPGAHNLLLTDWNFYMDFANRNWKVGTSPAKPITP